MISIFIPVLNEEEILESAANTVHDYLSTRSIAHEIVVVSNGSTDRTCEIGKRLEASSPWFRFYHLPERGAGRAFAFGVEQAKGDMVITLDVDLSSELTFLDYSADLLRYCDMLVGSKSMGNQRRNFVRVLGSQLYILFTQCFFGLTISDYSIGSKAFRRSAVLPALKHLDPWTGHIFEIVLFLRLHGHRVLQVGIDCDDKRQSRFNLIHEGLYRYRHLYRCRKLLKDRKSWLYSPN